MVKNEFARKLIDGIFDGSEKFIDSKRKMKDEYDAKSETEMNEYETDQVRRQAVSSHTKQFVKNPDKIKDETELTPSKNIDHYRIEE